MEEIRGRIQAGFLTPGTRLSAERELARSMQVTRPTLRSALIQLMEEGYLFVRRGKGGGWFVTDLSKPKSRWMERMARNLEELEDILDFRIAIEVMAARLAASRRTPEDLNEIDEAFADQEKVYKEACRYARDHRVPLVEIYFGAEPGSSPIEQSGVRFHDVVAKASHNTRLREAIGKVRAEIFNGGPDYFHDGIFATTLDDHRAIAEAIHAADPEKASRAMSRHLERGRMMIHKTMEKWR